MTQKPPLTPDERADRQRKSSRDYRRRAMADPVKYAKMLAANRVASLSQECIQHRREYDRYRQNYDNLTSEQIDRKREQARGRAKRYYAKQETKAKQRAAYAIKWPNDIQYKIAVILRTRIRRAIRLKYKSGSAVSDLGCSIAEFKSHIEQQFQSGMTWDNWSQKGWHLDHKRPLAMFDLTNPDEFRTAVHFTNYQPMWARENHAKGARRDDTVNAPLPPSL